MFRRFRTQVWETCAGGRQSPRRPSSIRLKAEVTRVPAPGESEGACSTRTGADSKTTRDMKLAGGYGCEAARRL